MKSAYLIAAAAAVAALGAADAVHAGYGANFYAPGETPYLGPSDSPFSSFSTDW